MQTKRLQHNNKCAEAPCLILGNGYNPVFDSCWKKKSLYPLYLLGYSDFCRCFGL